MIGKVLSFIAGIIVGTFFGRLIIGWVMKFITEVINQY